MKYRKLFVMWLLSIYFIPSYSFADDKSSDLELTAGTGSYKTKNISAGLEYTLKYKKPAKGDPVEMVYQFLETNNSLGPVSNPRTEFAPFYTNFDDKGGVVSFRQLFNGFKINHSRLNARFSESGELKRVEGEYHYDINLPSTYSIDSLEAVQIALRASGPMPNPKAACENEPIIIPSSDLNRHNERKVYMVWSVNVYPDTVQIAKNMGIIDKYIHFYVDALDGSVLLKENTSAIDNEPWSMRRRK